jgi:hypothetical protein
MLLVCLYGAPGVGKLSVGQCLERAGYLLLHDHLTIEAATAIFPFGSAPFSQLRSALFTTLLDAACSTEKDVIVTHASDMFWEPPFESILQACLRNHRYSPKRVFLRCSEAEHERRISDPSRSRYKKILSLDRLQSLLDEGEFEVIPARGGDLVLDTTRTSAEEAAAQIGLWLRAASWESRVA